MARFSPYTPKVVQSPIPASEVPAWNPEADSFVRVNVHTYPLLMGIASLVAERQFFEGTEEQITVAVNAMLEQTSEVILHKEDICDTPTPWGAAFRIRRDEGGGGVFEVMQGEGLPVPPWEFRDRVEGGAHNIEYRSVEGGGAFIPLLSIKEW